MVQLLSPVYGTGNFPQAFINDQEYDVAFSSVEFEYPGIQNQNMKGTEQGPLFTDFGADGVITINFNEVNTDDPITGFNESFRFVTNVFSENDVADLWKSSSEIRPMV